MQISAPLVPSRASPTSSCSSPPSQVPLILTAGVKIWEILGGWLGDFFILRGKLSVAAGRKIVNSLGFVMASLALMCMARVETVWMGVVCTTAVMGALGLSRGGFSVNHMDIAPHFAGIVMGISNTAGTISGVIGVAVTGAILESKGGSSYPAGWIQAFAVAALLCLAGNIFFVRSAKGERLFE